MILENLGIARSRAKSRPSGGETAATAQIGDRLDGKPAQAHIGGDDDDEPIKLLVTGVPRAGDE